MKRKSILVSERTWGEFNALQKQLGAMTADSVLSHLLLVLQMWQDHKKAIGLRPDNRLKRLLGDPAAKHPVPGAGLSNINIKGGWGYGLKKFATREKAMKVLEFLGIPPEVAAIYLEPPRFGTGRPKGSKDKQPRKAIQPRLEPRKRRQSKSKGGEPVGVGK